MVHCQPELETRLLPDSGPEVTSCDIEGVAIEVNAGRHHCCRRLIASLSIFAVPVVLDTIRDLTPGTMALVSAFVCRTSSERLYQKVGH
jgi:hypothetical protein